MPNVFDNSRQVLINGKVVESIVTSTGGVLYERLPSTFLSIDVPLNLVYSDAFLINGTLTDKNNEGIVGETVKLKVGSTVVDSTTTTTNGAYSFTQTPVSTGNHTFQVIYDESEEYSGSESSIVERVVGKETTVLSLTNPVNNSSVYTDGSISVSGSLVTDDNEKLSNKSIVVKEGNTTITTFTTNSNGVFTGSITGLNAGTHSLTFQFVSDSNYTGSSVARTVIVNNHSYSLSASVDQSSILLNDSVTITGVLLKDGTGYSNQTVTIYDGATSKGTCTTNSNGVYSKPVTGLTVGGHSLKAVTSVAESEVKTVNVYEEVAVATVTGNSITFGYNTNNNWLSSVGDVVIDWGDGSTNTVNNPATALTHTYTDGEQSHNIKFIGNVTSLGFHCFYGCTSLTSIVIPNSVTSLKNYCFDSCTGLTSVTIPSSVISLGMGCFYGCTGLTSVTIPDSVTNLGFGCFDGCTGLIDYQLYWEIPDSWVVQTMPNNTNTIFTIPQGKTANYVAKGYPSAKLVERGRGLTLTCPTPIIQKTDTATVTVSAGE